MRRQKERRALARINGVQPRLHPLRGEGRGLLFDGEALWCHGKRLTALSMRQRM